MKNTKSTKRKIKTEIVDGKTYIEKKAFIHYYVEKGFSIKDFNDHFNLGHRVVRQSLYKYFSKAERSKLHGKKISNKQKVNNSNSVNFFKPRNLIELDKLKEAIIQSKNQRQVIQRLGITKYVLTSNMQYYNLKFSTKFNRKAKKLNLIDILEPEQIEILKLLPLVNKDISNILNINNKNKITLALNSLHDLKFELSIMYRLLSKKLRRHSNNFNNCSNQVEYIFSKFLKEHNITYSTQLRIDNCYFDFYLPDHNLIVELDGNLHTKERDLFKNNLVLGKYRLLRINTIKTNKKHIEACFKNQLLPLLNQ